MSSYRWFALSVDGSPMKLDELDKVEAKPAYEEWISINERSSHKCAGEYFRNSIVSVNSRDGDGILARAHVNSLTAVEYVAFMRNGRCILRVKDNGRLSGPLISMLSRSLGYGFSFVALRGKQLFGNERSMFASFDSTRMIGLKLADIAVSPSVVGRFEFASKFGMTVGDISLVPQLGAKVSMSKYELVRSGVVGTLATFSTGRFIVNGRLKDFLVDFIEREIIDG